MEMEMNERILLHDIMKPTREMGSPLDLAQCQKIRLNLLYIKGTLFSHKYKDDSPESLQSVQTCVHEKALPPSVK